MSRKRDGLVPTRIVDVNGKRTTVHKRPEGKSWATGSAAAAPTSRAAVVSSPPTPAPSLGALATLAPSGSGVKIQRFIDLHDTHERESRQRVMGGSQKSIEYSDVEEAFDELSLDEKREVLRTADITLTLALEQLGKEELSESVIQNANFNVRTVYMDRFDGRRHELLEYVRTHHLSDLIEYVEKFSSDRWYEREGMTLSAVTGDKYDQHGFHAGGFDREGYMSNGYNKHRMTREGWRPDDTYRDTKSLYDPDGYDRNGRNVDGLTREQAAMSVEHGIDADVLLAMGDD